MMTTGSNRGFETVTSKDGTRIAYDKLGKGPPLLIVPGALGARQMAFSRKTADALAEHFTVYNYDRRGRGDSTDTKPYSVQREIEDLIALAEAAGGSPFVYGISSGAALALEAAARGAPVRKIVAYEPPYTAADPGSSSPADFEEKLQRYIAEGRRDDAVAYFMRVVGVPGLVLAIMKLFPFWKELRATAHTLPYDAAIMGRFEVPTERFGTIRTPTVIAYGSKTQKRLKVAAEAVARAVPGAELRIAPKQNHGIKPEGAKALLLASFTEASPRIRA